MVLTKSERLQRLATPDGVIAALAIDQRRSLRGMIAAAAKVTPDSVTDAQLSEFKALVTRHLSPYASAVLLDPEFGSGAFGERAADCGLLATYEMDGYDNPRPNRMLALMPEYSVRRLRDLGADGVKILLSWTPFADERSNDEKKVLIERIGHECDALGMPFFLEPVGYDPGGLDVRSAAYARLRPEIALRTLEEFSKEIYRVDVLKVEFPVDAAFVAGTTVFTGEQVWSLAEAVAIFRQADRAAGVPYIYLSAGVSSAHFLQSLELAAESGAAYSGVLCGRATWQDGIPVYAREGGSALERWLETRGVLNINAVNRRLRSAAPWQARAAGVSR